MKKAAHSVESKHPVPLEIGLRQAVASRDGDAFDRLVREWVEQRPQPLMSWGLYHLDAWGMDRALAQGAEFNRQHLGAYFDQLSAEFQEQFAGLKNADPLRAWPAIWAHLKDEPGFADDALLKVCLLWEQNQGKSVPVDWTEPRFVGLMSHVPKNGVLTWIVPYRGTYQVSALQLAWIGADAGVCKGLLAAGASPDQAFLASHWPPWTFRKATRNMDDLLRETMQSYSSGFIQNEAVSFLKTRANNHRSNLPSHNEESLACLVRWVSLNASLGEGAPSGPKPRF